MAIAAIEEPGATAPEGPRMWTVADAAAYLNVPERFVYRLAQERRVAFFKVGKYLRFRQEDLDVFLSASRREIPTPTWVL